MAGELSWLERRTHKPEVSGSIPLPATKNMIKFSNQFFITILLILLIDFFLEPTC